jgi:uncharacterized protein
MANEVRRNDEAGRYELFVDGSFAGFADYRVDGDRVILPHTVINPEMRGRQLGDELVRHALDDIRSEQRQVVPMCWFVAEYIQDHDEYADLLT